LRFFVHAKGVITHPDKRYELNLPNGRTAHLSTLDADSISEGKELVISGGGFSTQEEVYKLGMDVKNSLLLTGAKLRIGIDAGKNKASAWLSPSLKDGIFRNHGVKDNK
jgi:hypothetical protein